MSDGTGRVLGKLAALEGWILVKTHVLAVAVGLVAGVYGEHRLVTAAGFVLSAIALFTIYQQRAAYHRMRIELEILAEEHGAIENVDEGGPGDR